MTPGIGSGFLETDVLAERISQRAFEINMTPRYKALAGNSRLAAGGRWNPCRCGSTRQNTKQVFSTWTQKRLPIFAAYTIAVRW